MTGPLAACCYSVGITPLISRQTGPHLQTDNVKKGFLYCFFTPPTLIIGWREPGVEEAASCGGGERRDWLGRSRAVLPALAARLDSTGEHRLNGNSLEQQPRARASTVKQPI